MTTIPILGTLERVDVRTAWKSEAADFTPWLSSKDNISILGDSIGIDLEVEATEKNVGPFKADILCKDTATNSWVLIENQLERTDHTHLGQLLTYAAGLKAVTIVWIAPTFCDEHRAALDWLNEFTAKGVNFFGLEVELWRIGNSPPAPKFNIVCKPNDWSEAIALAASDIGELTETKKTQLAYWTALRDFMTKTPGKDKPQKPLPQGWTNFAVGRSNFSLVAVVNTVDQRIGAYLAIQGPHAKEFFAKLEEDRPEIDKEFGAPLAWREMLDRKESQIVMIRDKSDPLNEAEWPSQHAWFRSTLEQLYDVFSSRVKELDLAPPAL